MYLVVFVRIALRFVPSRHRLLMVARCQREDAMPTLMSVRQCERQVANIAPFLYHPLAVIA